MNNLPDVQKKQLNLKSYLSQASIRSQIADALPKWLSVDRFFKTVFSSLIRNPKLAECSIESILQSVMLMAQLGIEPVLGRAYLIPYQNTKRVGDVWAKVFECQVQIGYQGLVDLARRSDTIADVWGACVYENDEFELAYGLDRSLKHKPWYLDREKRKAGDPGECIGAYVVWQLKDGTKHPEFMPIHEINKRRAKSQSFTWAETGDPNKGGGKQDSVWHLWPEDMRLKTVIKHSSKLVPASIEFMRAVETDDGTAESGGDNLGQALLSDVQSAPPPQIEDTASKTPKIDAALKADPAIEKFISEKMVQWNMARYEILHAAEENFEDFRAKYSVWMQKQAAQPEVKKPAGRPRKPKEAPKQEPLAAPAPGFEQAEQYSTILDLKREYPNVYNNSIIALDMPQGPRDQTEVEKLLEHMEGAILTGEPEGPPAE